MLTVVGALKSELRYLLKHLSIDPEIPMGTGSLYPSRRIHLLYTGIGRKAVYRTFSEYLQNYLPECLLNIGLAGALADSLNVGTLIAVNTVSAENKVIEYELPIFPGTEHLKNGKVITVDRPVLSRRRKVSLYQKYGKELVDMELYHLAAIAREKAIPVYSIKIVSDQADEQTIKAFIKDYKALGATLGRFVFELLHQIQSGKTPPEDTQPPA